MDETGRPLYGDVFGTQQNESQPLEEDDQIETQPWGELESEESEEESEVCCEAFSARINKSQTVKKTELASVITQSFPLERTHRELSFEWSHL